MGWDAGTGSAGGCEPQQQQDARGHGCKGGHGAFSGVASLGAGSAAMAAGPELRRINIHARAG